MKQVFVAVAIFAAAVCGAFAQPTSDTILYNFFNSSCGYKPNAPATLYKGNLYFVVTGDRAQGGNCGANNAGQLMEWNVSTSTLTVLADFPTTGSPMDSPQGPIGFDAAGNIWGVSSGSPLIGENNGAIWEATVASGYSTLTLIHQFNGGSDGCTPTGGVIIDTGNNVYGSALSCGTNNNGTVWEYKPSTSTFSVLHTFGGTDGKNPGRIAFSLFGDYAQVNQVHIYGMTQAGGSGTSCGTSGCGTLFMIEVGTSGNPVEFVSLYSFQGGTADGYSPQGAPVWGLNGLTVYGVTASGGLNGRGVLWSFNGTYRVIYNFLGNGIDCQNPAQGLVSDSSGNLFVTSYGGGGNGNGGICKFTRSPVDGSFSESVYYGFLGGPNDGSQPNGPLNIIGTTFYGLTQTGGNNGGPGNPNCDGNNCGTVLSLPLQ
jgi:uncharacterized repeat protein (TIGR03803 family)